MSNRFQNAVTARIALETANATMSASNLKKLETMHARLKSKEVFDVLNAVACDVAVFSDNVYTCEKLVNLAVNAVQMTRDFNEMNSVIFQTAMRCAANATTMTLKDAQDACSADRKVESDRKHLVVQRRETTSDATVRAQHQSTVAALLALNVLSAVAHNSRERHFAVNTENAVYQKLSAQIKA